MDEWVSASAAIAGMTLRCCAYAQNFWLNKLFTHLLFCAENSPDSVNHSVLDEEGLPSPPLDEAALLVTQPTTLELSQVDASFYDCVFCLVYYFCQFHQTDGFCLPFFFICV